MVDNELPQLRKDARVYKIGGGGWGRHLSWWDFDNLRVTGHYTPMPVEGDEAQVEMKNGKTARLVIHDLDYKRNPPDMFFASVHPFECTDGTPLEAS